MGTRSSGVEASTVRIGLGALAVMEGRERRPLSQLERDSHVHGTLELEIGGRLVPRLGFWGPDDVCFGVWIRELDRAARALGMPNGRHVFDEGEEGQPAFLFEREGSRAFLSLVASRHAAHSGGHANPEWQRVKFRPQHLIAENAKLQASFFTALREAAPHAAGEWIARALSHG